MTRRVLFLLSSAQLLFCTPVLAQAPAPSRAALRVVNAGPTGEVAQGDEANEVRIVFSEPMVTLGRIPARPRPAFFHVNPPFQGTFRWSGTTILIYTPARRLPNATRYDVTIDATATSVAGRKLAAPYTFSFTTPTVRLNSTAWYRPGERYDAAPIVVLRFNQPVRADDVLAHVSAQFKPHPFAQPVIPAQARAQAADPNALTAFAAKVQSARAAASSAAPVALRLATNWDRKRFPPARDQVVLEATTTIPPESWVQLKVDGRTPSLTGPAVSEKPQDYTIQVEPAFFIRGFHCVASCDPDRHNPLEFRNEVKVTSFAPGIAAFDVTDPRRERAMPKSTPKERPDYMGDGSVGLSFEDAGFQAQPPATTWAAVVSRDLKAADGQVLGYTWAGTVENWHQRAFTSFGDGHGVWEKGGGGLLPFYARNFQNVKQWAAAIKPPDLMSTLTSLQAAHFAITPQAEPVGRRLGGAPDKINSHGLDISKVLTPAGTGLVWAAVEEGDPIARAESWRGKENEPATRATLVQVTNLGISVKDSPQNTLVFVTRLDTGVPVAGARVSIVKPDGSTQWSGTTEADGVAMAPQSRLRSPRKWYEFAFIVTAEKDGDVAYVGSDWNEGVQPWDFGTRFDLEEADPLLRGSVFTDRGVYRLGEEVHFKAILRHNTPSGIRLLPAGTPVVVKTLDSRNKTIDERTIKLGAWSTADWTLTLPAEGTLGDYTIRAILESDRPAPSAAPAPRTPDEQEEEEGDFYGPLWKKTVTGSFLVAAYRRPDFRVDVTLTGDTQIAGDPLKGVVTARYLFGAPMAKRATHWSLTRAATFTAPDAITAKYPEDRWTFVGYDFDPTKRLSADVASNDAPLTPDGKLPLDLNTEAAAGIPYAYTLEGDVEDVSRQHIANRARVVVHPAPFYVGLKRVPFFSSQADGLKTEVVVAGLDGTPKAGVDVDLKLTQIQWLSVRRAEGNGFYTWETQRKEVFAGEWHVTSAMDPVPFTAPLPAGGLYVLEARAGADRGRYAVTRTTFYGLGKGYTAWERYDHNRIDLVPEKTKYRPGDTARIMIQSPWEQATALVTTEREGIRSHRQFTLTSTQQSIDIPIAEDDIPNLFVSVLLVKGRSKPVGDAQKEDDPSDPGKPSFRLGYVELKVEDASKRLTVAVAANKEEYRPANSATVTVDVKDRDGRGTVSEVTLWAVDYGVLSLTSFQTPDVLGSVYVQKALQILNEDNRQRIISRRVLTPKGETDGGGGGAADGPGTVRRDFRVLAFWLGSVTTDGRGHASADVKLPESLTTYRIMAVAGDRSSRFGSADAEIRINKPVTLKAAFPRFLAVGDKALFGAVVTSQLKTGGEATVTIASLDPEIMQFADTQPQRVNVDAGGSTEVRFEAAGRAIGRARVRVTVRLANETDAFEDTIPVEVLVSPETVSAVGEATDANATALEKLTIPDGVVPGFGGLHVEVASTALVGLGEGARYLLEYPYGCAEQRGSRALALLLTADLGSAFKLPGVDPAHLRSTVQASLKELEKFQCESGGFAYWPGACYSTSPYLTSYLLHVFKVASDLNYTVDKSMRDRAYTYLEQSLAQPPPENEGWWPSYTAWQAFAVKVLVEGGRNQDSNITRLYGYRERMPVFALAYLHDALLAKGETSGAREEDLRRRIGNAILPEAATAHVEELDDPYLLWFWNSNIRSTAIVLNSMVRASQADAPYPALVRWLLKARAKGRWSNTQENALALEALVSYYRKYESTVPNFTAAVSLGSAPVASEKFSGRTTEAKSADVPMQKLLASGKPGTEQPLTFTRTGQGTLFYSARLRYAVDQLFQQGLDSGIRVTRTYAPYVENGTRPATLTYNAGDLVRVTLTLQLTKERRFVAVTDPLPAGFEPVESWFTTSARALARAQDTQEPQSASWYDWFDFDGFDHVERHDDRVELFATRLSEGRHTFSYIVRATTTGTFRTAPAHAEEMYEPEVFGRTATTMVEVKK